MSATNPYTDVVELCALLQSLGFSVKLVETSDGNVSQEGNVRTVVINCQASGLHVVMESHNVLCSCPAACQQQNSGFWQVSGVTGGKHFDKLIDLASGNTEIRFLHWLHEYHNLVARLEVGSKVVEHNNLHTAFAALVQPRSPGEEYGSNLLGCLPKVYRERLTKELLEIVRCIKEYNEFDVEKPKGRESLTNMSASMIDLKTPEKRLLQMPSGTPTRYRSLDTLTTTKDTADQNLPAPGPLQKHHIDDKLSTDVNEENNKKHMYERQSTYTLSSTPDSIRRRNKTSSPIQGPEHKLLENLRAAEKAAEDLRNRLASIVKEYSPGVVDAMHDASMNSLVLDVSKISVLKGAETSKAQFASSPNLSALGGGGDDISRSRLKRMESASTSNLAFKQAPKDGKTMSKLRRISPNLFKFKKDSATINKAEKATTQENKTSKLNTLFKPKVTTPARIPKVNLEPSPNLSQSRKKFSHVKSTIPRPSVKKE